MRGKTLILAAALMAASSSSAQSGGKGGSKPQLPFVPSIGYTYLSGTSTDLRIANEEGSQAVLVHRSDQTIIFDLSPRSRRAIAYASGNRLAMRSWSTGFDGAFVLGGEKQIYEGVSQAAIQAVDFSPDGTKLLFTTVGFDDAALRIVDLQQDGYPVVETKVFHFVTGARWKTDGAGVYAYGRPTDAEPLAIYDMAEDGSLSSLEAGLNPLVFLDSTRLPGPSGLWFSSGSSIYSRTSSGVLSFFGTGYDPHPSCDNTRLLFGLETKRGRSIVIAPVTAASSISMWSNDKNIRRIDWMPGCA